MKDGNRIMGTPGEAKYGFTRHQLTEGVRILMSKGVASFGLHAFLASNSLDKDYYPKLAGMLFETAVEIHNETGASIDFINLSGGIGIPYLPEEEEIDLEYIGREVEKIYNNVILSSGLGDIELKTELGRFITGPAGYLITHAIHEKHTYKEYIGLDACAANLMRPAMYGAYHHITVMGKETCPADHIYDITGGLCENNDKFAVDRKLPKIDMGDIVVLHDTGAHSFSMGYNYNGKLRSAELLLSSDSSVKLIRRAETPSDYFATLDFTGLFDKILKINFSKQYIDK
jgi:diaminopimelate decarboxylase